MSIMLGVTLLAAGLLLGWASHAFIAPRQEAEEYGDEDEEAGLVVSPSEMDVAVTTAQAEAGALPEMEPAVGVVRVDEKGSVTISSRAGGRVVAVETSPGADVHKGDVLLRFDPLPLDAAVVQATTQSTVAQNALDEFDKAGRKSRELELRVGMEKAKSNTKLAESKLALVDKSFKDGLVSDRALEEAKQAAAQAQAELTLAEQALQSYQSVGADLQHAGLVAAVRAAESALAEAKIAAEQATVKSEADGQVTALNVRVGDRADAGAALGTITMRRGRVLSVGVSADVAPRVSSGAAVTWIGRDHKPRSGKVRAVQEQVDSTTGLMEVLVTPDSQADLPLGLMVRAQVQVGVLPESTLVPRAALVRMEDETSVVKVGPDGAAKVVAVEVLGEYGDRIAVRGDVSGGDRVIIDGGYNLPDGAKVHEKDSEPIPASADSSNAREDSK
ncbi:MAG: biotin/lipoyl-binding protein [Phycisphaera sp.]|nr:biotin/lipoyl-binding protein [Phycisphaera sp.]